MHTLVHARVQVAVSEQDYSCACMLLAAGQGTTVKLRLDGPDEADAMQAASDLFGRGFDEGS